MAQNVTVAGASYSDVPAVLLPKTGGGTARFDDTSDADAAAGDILAGKKAYVNGAKVTGTAPGGWKLLAKTEVEVNTTSTSAGTAATIDVGAEASTASKIICVKVRDKLGGRNGRFVGSDTFFFNYLRANGSTSDLTYGIRVIHRRSATGEYTSYTAGQATGYGVYGYAVSSSGVITVRRRYSSDYSLTVNSTYDIEVYALEYAPAQGNPYDFSFPAT